jgi:putative tricarboxylic transport membrane protein
VDGSLLEGTLLALQPANLAAAVAGVLLGVLFGAIPGLTATLGVALLVPVTFVMAPATGMIMLTGVYAGAIYAGAITAILLRIPGTPASIPTTWDGYPLTQQGQPRLALGTAALASGLGGLFSGVVLLTLSPALARLALTFGAAEYVALVLLGLIVVVFLLEGPLIRSAAGVFTGVGLGLVGLDPALGFPRYSFGQYQLAGGLAVVPMLIGVFCIIEAVRLARQSATEYSSGGSVEMGAGRRLPSLSDLRRNGWNFTRSSAIGVGLGVLPAIGPETTPFVSYAAARRASKLKDLFGKGSLEGLIAAESSNNANVGGSLIPTLALGIPGSAVAAVFLGALTLHGLRPGPLLFVEQPVLVYALFMGFLLVNVFMLIGGILLVRQFAVVLRLPHAALATAVAFFSVVGAFAIGSNIFNVWVMFGSALLAAVLLTARIPLAPVVLGLILGPLLETNLVRALAGAQGDWTVFLRRPVAAGILLAALVVVVVVSIKRVRAERAVTS